MFNQKKILYDMISEFFNNIYFHINHYLVMTYTGVPHVNILEVFDDEEHKRINYKLEGGSIFI